VDDAARRSPVTYEDIEAAALRLEGVAHRTPVATSRLFDEQTGAQAFFKEMGDQVMPTLKRLQSAMTESARITQQISQIMKDAEENASKCFHI